MITQDLKLNDQEVFILSNSNYRCCPKHPQNWIVSLSTDPNSDQFLQCAECYSNNPHQQTLHLFGLIKDNEKTFFKNYPVSGESDLTEKLKEVFESEYSVDGVKNKISTFFQNLRKSIDEKINLKEEEMKNQAKSIWNTSDQVIVKYNQLAEKEQLKKIIYDFKDDFKKQNELFREVFTRISTNQDKYKTELQERINQIGIQNSMINFEAAQKINENVLKLIDGIDMFVIKNLNSVRINQKEEFELFLKKIDKFDKNEATTSQLMVKLMSNKLNFCSNELIEQLQQIVFTLSNSIDQVDVKKFLNKELLHLDFDKMNHSTTDILIKQSQRFLNLSISEEKNNQNKEKLIKLISNKFNFCNQSFLQKLSDQLEIIQPIINTLDFKDYLQQDKSPIDGSSLSNAQLLEIAELVKSFDAQNNLDKNEESPSDIVESEQSLKQQNLIKFSSLLENKTNFCSDSFITKAKNSIQKYSEITQNLFLNVNIFSNDRDKNIDFNKFTTNQINNLEKLANKITELNEKFGESYYNRVSPDSIQQLKSYSLQKKIEGNEHIEQLLVNYPIFEMTDSISQFQFIKTAYESSEELILERNDSFSYKLKQVKSLNGQIVTKEKLDPNISYIFRCKINKKLDCNYIAFGITKTEDTKIKGLIEEQCSFCTSDRTDGLDKILKGKYLTEVVRDLDYIEVRVNISNRIVLFMDYPKYENINQVSEEKIISNVDYSFGISFATPGDNYEIDIESILYDDESYNPLNFEVN